MEPAERDRQLSQISTEWDMVFRAHQGAPEQVSAAQAELMNRYAGAVHRHLLGWRRCATRTPPPSWARSSPSDSSRGPSTAPIRRGGGSATSSSGHCAT